MVLIMGRQVRKDEPGRASDCHGACAFPREVRGERRRLPSKVKNCLYFGMLSECVLHRIETKFSKESNPDCKINFVDVSMNGEQIDYKSEVEVEFEHGKSEVVCMSFRLKIFVIRRTQRSIFLSLRSNR